MTTSTAPRYLSAAATHQGNVRGNNEDRVHADDARGIYVVIDGMGGQAAGERAADIALEVIRTRLERQTDDTPQRMREAITLANNAIYEAARKHPEWAGMACVLTAVVIEGTQVTVGHVGDSRLYRIQGGRIEKITRDHSPVGEREDRGELNEAEAMRHPRRNEVFRDVGSQPRTPGDEAFIDIHNMVFAPASALLLCSDGLSDALPSGTILATVERGGGDRQVTVERLVEAAVERGKDNVSVVLVQGEKFAASGGAPAKAPSRWTSAWLIAACLIGGMLLGALLTRAAMTAWDRAHPGPHPGPVVLSVVAPASIAAALDGAKAGDTVQIAPGTYPGNIALKSGVSLIGTDPNRCVINGVITARDVDRVRVRLVTIRGGLDLRDSNVDIERCIITGGREAGIRYNGKSGGLLLANAIRDNPGAGVLVSGTATPDLRNNIITSNGKAPASLRPGLLISLGAHPRVTSNTFAGNGAEPVWLPAGLEELLQKNFFVVPRTGRAPRLYRPTPEKLP